MFEFKRGLWSCCWASKADVSLSSGTNVQTHQLSLMNKQTLCIFSSCSASKITEFLKMLIELLKKSFSKGLNTNPTGRLFRCQSVASHLKCVNWLITSCGSPVENFSWLWDKTLVSAPPDLDVWWSVSTSTGRLNPKVWFCASQMYKPQPEISRL